MRTLLPLLVTILLAIYYYKPPTSSAETIDSQTIPIEYNKIYRIVLDNPGFLSHLVQNRHALNFENGGNSVMSLRISLFLPFVQEGVKTALHYAVGEKIGSISYQPEATVLVYYFAFVEEGLIIKFEYPRTWQQPVIITSTVSDIVTHMRFEDSRFVISAAYIPQNRIKTFLDRGTWDGDNDLLKSEPTST